MFARRIFLYLTGFLMGSIIAYFLIFRGRNQSFFPSSIIIDTLKSKEIVVEKKAECRLACNHVSPDIKKLLDDAEVIFSESNPRETPKKYVVEARTTTGEKLKLTFELSEKNATVIEAEIPTQQKSCGCE